MDLMALIVTVCFIAIVCVIAFYIFRWMALPEPWNMVVRILLGLVALVVLVGFVTGRVPLIAVHL
jgi:uncharacterized membrane protein